MVHGAHFLMQSAYGRGDGNCHTLLVAGRSTFVSIIGCTRGPADVQSWSMGGMYKRPQRVPARTVVDQGCCESSFTAGPVRVSAVCHPKHHDLPPHIVNAIHDSVRAATRSPLAFKFIAQRPPDPAWRLGQDPCNQLDDGRGDGFWKLSGDRRGRGACDHDAVRRGCDEPRRESRCSTFRILIM